MMEATYEKGFLLEESLGNGQRAPSLGLTVYENAKLLGLSFGYSDTGKHEQGATPLQQMLGVCGSLGEPHEGLSTRVIRAKSGVRLTTGVVPAGYGDQTGQPFAILELSPGEIDANTRRELRGSACRNFFDALGVTFGTRPSEMFRTYWNPESALAAVVGTPAVQAVQNLYDGFESEEGIALVAPTGHENGNYGRKMLLLRVDAQPEEWKAMFLAFDLKMNAIARMARQTGIVRRLREAGKFWALLQPVMHENRLYFELMLPIDPNASCQGGLMSVEMLEEWIRGEGVIPSGDAIKKLGKLEGELLEFLDYAMNTGGMLSLPSFITYRDKEKKDVGLYIRPNAHGKKAGLSCRVYSSDELVALLQGGIEMRAAQA